MKESQATCSSVKQIFGRNGLTAHGKCGRKHFLIPIMKVPENRSPYHDVTRLKLKEVLNELEKVTEICCYITNIRDGGRSTPKITDSGMGMDLGKSCSPSLTD